MSSSRLAFVALGAAIFAGCGDDDVVPPMPDAGFDAGTDAGFDAGPPPSTLFGPCVEDSQCPGEDAICRHGADGYPDGYCTVPCMDRTPCDDGVVFNHCVTRTGDPQGYCEQRCLNGVDCARPGYTCTNLGRFDTAGSGICEGLCGGGVECGEGAECNIYGGDCVPEGELPTDGSPNGGPCTTNEECLSSLCSTERRGTTTTGFVGGYCFGFCILPLGYNTNTLFAEDTLPQGGCPENGVCFPNGSYTEGDLGVCYAGCLSDDDCRFDEAYTCRTSYRLASGDIRTFTNGTCVPINCLAGGVCPTGFRCRTVTAGRLGVCDRL